METLQITPIITRGGSRGMVGADARKDSILARRLKSTTFRTGSSHFGSGPRAPRFKFSPAWAFGGIGLAMLLSAGIWCWTSVRFKGAAARAEGTVVRIDTEYARPAQDGSRRPAEPLYNPVVRFRAASGRETEITGLGVGGAADYEVGERVSVLYPPDRPEAGKIDSGQEFWLGPLVCALFGALFGGAGFLIHRLKL